MQHLLFTTAVAVLARLVITQTIDPNSVPLSTRRECPRCMSPELLCQHVNHRELVQLSNLPMPIDLSTRGGELGCDIFKHM